MSRRPGIGKVWYEMYGRDIYVKDYFTINGKKFKPPKYYDDMAFGEDQELEEMIKAKRRQNAIKNKEDNTYERLEVREKVAYAKESTRQREL